MDAIFEELRRVAAAEGWPNVRRRTAENTYRGRAAYDRHGAETAFLTYSMDSAAQVRGSSSSRAFDAVLARLSSGSTVSAATPSRPATTSGW